MKLKKLIAVSLAGIMSAAMLASCGGNTQSTQTTGADESLKKVQEKGSFTIGLDADFAPMGFTQDDGEIVGFDIDLAKAVAEKMGVSLEVKPIVWDS